MADLIQFRRDTAANWAAANPVLAAGELGLEIDTQRFKIGNGSTAWNSIDAYGFSPTAPTVTYTETTEPTAEAGTLVTYTSGVGGRLMPKFIGPAGMSSALQPFLARNKVGYWAPPGSATTLPAVFGYTALTTVGTATARAITTANMFTRTRRLGFVSAATANALASARMAVAQVTLGDGTLGGFHKVVRFAISDAVVVSGARMFVGVSSNINAPTNVEPSTLTNGIGVGHGAADTNLRLYYGGSAAQTPIDLGANFPSNTTNTDLYELALFAPPSGGISYEVVRLNTGHVATGTLAAGGGVALPAPTTLLTPMWAYRTNNATAAAVGLDLVSDYFETDL